jgi:hypothetical protein
MGQEAADKVKSAGNQPDFSCSGKGRLRKIFAAGLGGQQNFLISDMSRTRLWTVNPECRQERIRSAHSGLRRYF